MIGQRSKTASVSVSIALLVVSQNTLAAVLRVMTTLEVGFGWWLPLRTSKWTHNVHRRFDLSPVSTTWPTVNCKVFQTYQMLRSMMSCTVINDAYVGGSCNLGRETGLVANNSPIAVLQARPYI
jgi:hypothetical protein